MHHAEREPAGQVTVYLDVSGSMSPWLPVLLEALTESAALVPWPLFGFSTEVHPVTRSELASSRFRSTGGTHIASVARHLAESRVGRAVVITDGDVQEIPSALADRLRRAKPRVRVGLLDGCSGSFCAQMEWPVARVPALDEPGR
nr:vWA domain-containing protein [Hyphomicrobium sp.]